MFAQYKTFLYFIIADFKDDLRCFNLSYVHIEVTEVYLLL